MDQLKQFLFARFKEQQACVLFIDEAQQMKGSLLESLRGLLNFEDPAAGGKLLQIILLAMPGINRKLRFAPSFSNRVVRTQFHCLNCQERADAQEWRFVQVADLDFACCFAVSGTSLAVLALDCYWPIGDISRSWKLR